jgi:hypothetical protein
MLQWVTGMLAAFSAQISLIQAMATVMITPFHLLNNS